LFAESNTRFLVEVQQENETEVTKLLSNSYKLIGTVTEDSYLRVTSGKEKELAISVSIADLKEAWQKPLRW
jgi:phosphoribosylformylglycinamidine synthase